MSETCDGANDGEHCECYHDEMDRCCYCYEPWPYVLDTREDDALEQARRLTEDPA